MNILFLDTETTGVPKNYKAPVTDLENWPRLVQLGFIGYETDGIEVFKSFENEHIITPVGFTISEQVSKIHGITQEKALTDGEDLMENLYHFGQTIEWADLLVGHNLSYDLNVMGAEFIRMEGKNPLDGKKTFDTMTASTDLCKLPGGYGGKYKWPKLSELYQYLFHEPLAQTHTALDDIQNTAKCYFELKRLGHAN
jgi:DNA polymerase III epsilon subunit-like protein